MVVLHAVEDALVNPLVIDGYISFGPNAEWIFSPISGILPTLSYLVVGLWLRKKRKSLGGNTADWVNQSMKGCYKKN